MTDGEREIKLVRCPVCYNDVSVHQFGEGNKGVWVGCTFSPECARYIEYHKDGWTVDEAMLEWNKKNTGFLGFVRRIKIWFRLHGFFKRAEEKKWEKEQKNKEKEAKLARKKELKTFLDRKALKKK